MNGEVYVCEIGDMFAVIHMSRSGDSSGIERGYPTRAAAEAGAHNMAKELGALFVPPFMEGGQ